MILIEKPREFLPQKNSTDVSVQVLRSCRMTILNLYVTTGICSSTTILLAGSIVEHTMTMDVCSGKYHDNGCL